MFPLSFLSPGYSLIFLSSLQVLPGEPVYAQVNRDKKKNSRGPQDAMQAQQQQLPPGYQDYGDHQDHWQVANHQGVPMDAGQQQQQQQQAAGDSWV